MNPAQTVRLFKIIGLAVAIAAPAEGLRRVAYADLANPALMTACYGSTHGVKAGQQFSLAECHQRLSYDMAKAIEYVDRCAPGLPDNVVAALADAVFNLGPAIVCDKSRSTLARLLAEGRVAEACEQLPRWNKARVGGVMVPLPGLTARREAERRLCLTGSM